MKCYEAGQVFKNDRTGETEMLCSSDREWNDEHWSLYRNADGSLVEDELTKLKAAEDEIARRGVIIETLAIDYAGSLSYLEQVVDLKTGKVK